MTNIELIEWTKLWFPELNTLQIEKLRDKFSEIEKQGYDKGFLDASA